VAVQPSRSAFIWSTDLKLGQLPAVCVKTGRRADASVRYRFITVPGWAYAFLLLALTGIGLLVPFIIMRVVSRTASGRLPFNSPVARRIKIWRWVLVAAFVAIPVLLVGAVWSLGGDTYLAALAWSLLLADLLGTLAVRYLVLPTLGPKGHVHKSAFPHGRWVELRAVHPAFAAAVAEMYELRRAGILQPQPPSPPQGVELPSPPA
jgi:hypothetical protein